MTVSQTPELLFADQVDVDTDEAMMEEMFHSSFQHHPYHVVDQSVPLNIYGEPIDEPEYLTVAPSFPLHVKINPQAQELNKYGFDKQRDALVFFSTKIMRELKYKDKDGNTITGLKPKVGDRVDFIYLDASGNTVLEHLELVDASETLFARQTKAPYQLIATAMRTQKAKKP